LKIDPPAESRVVGGEKKLRTSFTAVIVEAFVTTTAIRICPTLKPEVFDAGTQEPKGSR
jgi:hypothetical protein